MSLKYRHSPSEFAFLAETAVRLGLSNLAQRFLNFAYERANDGVVADYDHDLEKLWFEYLDAGRRVAMTERQTQLLRLFTQSLVDIE